MAKLDSLTSAVESECKVGCMPGDRKRGAPKYDLPKKCKCVQQFVVHTVSGAGGYTPPNCAMSMLVFSGVRTESEIKSLPTDVSGKKEHFTAVGCSIDASQKDCMSAALTSFTPRLKFVQHVNQEGKVHGISAHEQQHGLAVAPKREAGHSMHVHVRVTKSEPWKCDLGAQTSHLALYLPLHV